MPKNFDEKKVYGKYLEEKNKWKGYF